MTKEPEQSAQSGSARTAPSKRKEKAEDRMARLMALVPWVAERDGPTVDEVCERFECTPGQLVADLDLLLLCGAYPYSPDQLMEAWTEDDRVWIRYTDWFKRPLHLSHAEGLALVACARALLDVPGSEVDGPLARGLRKVAAVLGVDPDEGFAVALGDADQSVLATLTAALDAGRRVTLAYYSFGRDVHTTRVVSPWRVHSVGGAWYLRGWCHDAGGERRFRIDRVRRATMLGERADPAPAGVDLGDRLTFSPDPSDPVVVLDLLPAARWVAGQYPLARPSIEQPDGALRVALQIAGPAFFERLMLRVGPNARVVDAPAHLRAGASAAAGRVLGRYR